MLDEGRATLILSRFVSMVPPYVLQFQIAEPSISKSINVPSHSAPHARTDAKRPLTFNLRNNKHHEITTQDRRSSRASPGSGETDLRSPSGEVPGEIFQESKLSQRNKMSMRLTAINEVLELLFTSKRRENSWKHDNQSDMKII